MTKTVCDRCGEECLPEGAKVTFSSYSHGMEKDFDFCKDCCALFESFMNGDEPS